MFQQALLQELVDIFCFLCHLHGIQRLISSNQDRGVQTLELVIYRGYSGLCMYVEIGRAHV